MTASRSEIRRFQGVLVAWYDRHKRDLPWRRTKDPYAIWISEVMLQQTRVAAVIPFYQRFLNRFPNFEALARAEENELLAYWAGLGYYHRARNVLKAARVMCEAGSFPTSYDEIRALPGIGEYTSAAVASIGFNLPFAAVDGNVLRVLSRALADGADTGSGAGRKHFFALAQTLVPSDRPGAFNQAMMELGATVCLPKNPQCLLCPIASLCRARQAGRQNEFPIKLRSAKSKVEERVLFWIERNQNVLLWQRPADSRLMPGFWELPEAGQLRAASAGRRMGVFRHSITFRRFRFEIRLAEAPVDAEPYQWVPLSSLTMLPASTVFRKAQRVVEAYRNGPSAQQAAVG